MPEVDYVELKKNVKELNAACGTKIRTVGTGSKKAEIEKAFSDAMKSGIEKVPENVAAFYKDNFPNQSEGVETEETEVQEAETEETEVQEAETEEVNLAEMFAEHCSSLGVEVEKGDTVESMETKLINAIDSLDDAEWKALPAIVRDWDAEIAARITESPAAPPEAPKSSSPTGNKRAAASKAKPGVLRAGFKFSEGTSSSKIIAVLEKLNAKGEGASIDDIVAAATKAGVQSKNLVGRVSTTLGYARKPEGGVQVVKKGTLFYVADAVVE